ncbi:hypothetical protein SEA_DIZZYRUDY_1 [Microbacterium phage DizzyRudy]|nr:hypothetical protein SEA_DIZZYRUDY_1 [Microbacterium phage DizzyRudy]
MAEVEVSAEDATAIKSILLQWRSEGVENPLLPMEVDVNGDGVADSFGLDENDEVVVVLGSKLEDTVYVSEGDDIGPEGS